jgi:hypothetical protein
VNFALACLKCQFHKVTLLKSLGQDQQAPSGGEVVQLGPNWLTIF